MNNLEWKIKQLEDEINSNRILLSQQKASLKQRITTPSFLTCSILGSFAVGFLLGHRKTSAATKRVLITFPASIKEIYQNARAVASIVAG